MPRISVIMGEYNCNNYNQLEKSVLSIINQTYTDWEFIICDDGSNNTTREYLSRIQSLDNRIKVIGYKENKGLAYALNECIKNANGEFIARQDDDDISEPCRFEKQIRFLDCNKDFDIVGSTAIKFDDTGDLGILSVPENPEPRDFLWNSPFIHPTVLIRKSALEKVFGYRVSNETMRGQDYDLFMRMYGNKMKGHNIQEPLYHYRMVQGGYKKRPLKIRIGEMKVRAKGFKMMGILLPNLIFVIKPLILGLLPLNILNKLRNAKENRKNKRGD